MAMRLCYICTMIETTLRQAMDAGARQLQHYFNGRFEISNKEGINNLVTEADHASEKAIIERIREDFPDHFILSEETGEIKTDSDIKWIIDPIDGTVNFANGIPICCVSIGIEKSGQMILAAVYNPFMNEFFFAEKGKGAFLNDQRIFVSKKTKVQQSCMVTGFPYTYLDMPNGPIQVFERLIRRGVYTGPLVLNHVMIGGGADGPNPYNLMEFVRRTPPGAVLTMLDGAPGSGGGRSGPFALGGPHQP